LPRLDPGSICHSGVLRDGAVETRTKFDDAPPGDWDSIGVRHIPQGWVFDCSIAGASFRFHPIFPSAMVLSKELATSVGGYNSNLPARAEDGEFTLRCLYRAKVPALPEPLVHIRKHEANISRDLVPRLIAEIKAFHHARENHSEAGAFLQIIDDEIEIRGVMAFDAAFAAKDDVITASLFERLPQNRRTLKVRVKNAISRMPDFLGKPINASLQVLMSGRAQDPGLR
jgi:hypothetical protein